MDDRRKLEIAGWAAAALVLVLLAARVLGGGGGSEGAPVSVAGPGAERGPGAPERPKPQLLVVDVEGEVRRPGITRVPAGSRVEAAVRQAGGLTRRGDATAVNLAAPLQDGQQIVVPRRGERGRVAAAPGVGGAAPATGAGGGGAPVSLSSATVAELDTIDGIGPTLAQRIVDYRDEHGGFRSIDELKQVEGIGEKRFESLREGLQP